MSKKLTQSKVNEAIKAAQLKNEEYYLAVIAEHNKIGEGYQPTMYWMRKAALNALDRLEKKGLIRWHHSRKLSTYGKMGYWLTAK